jgi:hypothetical protein
MRVFFRRGLVLGLVVAAASACVAALGGNAPAAVTHGPIARGTAPNHRLSNSTSTNWSGYAVTGGRYTSVSASWTQPAVDCSATPTGWSSFWVGLDGDGTNTVEQTGTEADCSSGQAVYSSWYEMYPKFPKSYSDPVAPGDSFTASVTTDGRGSFTLTLTNNTRGWTRTTNARLKNARLGSAEVIAEAPSSSGGVLPLADFGTASFAGATANGLSLASQHPDAIDMVSGSTTKASTSSISNSGDFTVTWQSS